MLQNDVTPPKPPTPANVLDFRITGKETWELLLNRKFVWEWELSVQNLRDLPLDITVFEEF